MKIAIIGTGHVGRALGSSWAKKGHQVIFGTRDPNSNKVQNLLETAGPNTSATSASKAVMASNIVVLAIPWHVAQQVIESLDDLVGKIVVDVTNPIGPDLQLTVGTTSSGGEQVAQWAAGASVVKAFNTTGWENMVNPIYGSEPTAMFICGDDADAKATVAQLTQELGFDVIDTGALTMARHLEPLAMVWINLAMGQGWGRDFAFKIVKR